MCFLTSFTFCIHVKDEKVIILMELGKLKEECLLLRRGNYFLQCLLKKVFSAISNGNSSDHNKSFFFSLPRFRFVKKKKNHRDVVHRQFVGFGGEKQGFSIVL